MPTFAPALTHQQIVQDLTRKLGQHFQTLLAQIPHAANGFELKGDLIVFKNTDALAKDLHKFMANALTLIRQVLPHLRKGADDLARAGRSFMVTLVSHGALGLSSPDPTIAQLARVLAQLGAADVAGTVTGELSALLRRFADALEKKSRMLDHSQLYVRAKIWAGFSGNAFNWRTRRFEATASYHLIARAANAYKLNPKIAAIEMRFRQQAPRITAGYYTEFLLKKLADLGMAASTAALVAAALGWLWDELTMQDL